MALFTALVLHMCWKFGRYDVLDTWWTELRAALAALAGFRTFRVSGWQS